MTNNSNQNELKVITTFAVINIVLILLISITNIYTSSTIHKTTNDIFNHPLKVSNAALNIQNGVLKIHRDMKDIVLSNSRSEIEQLIHKVDKEEQNVYQYLKIIETNILGQEGLCLEQNCYKLFKEWKSIRDSVIELTKNKQYTQAIAITQQEGANHVRKLEHAALELHNYARVKANGFKAKAEQSFSNIFLFNIVLVTAVISLLILFSLYLHKRIHLYLKKIEESETKLSRLNERYRLAIEGANDGLWDWDLVNESVYFSPRFKEMLGYRDDELENSFESWKSRVHPDDLEQTLKAIELAHSNKNITYDNIHRLRHKDGSWVWIHDRGQTLFDANDKPIRMVGFHTDITKQKEQEQKILSLSRLLNNTINSFENLIFVKDENFIYKECNRAFEQFLGRSREDIIGKDDYELFDKEMADMFRENDKKVLASTKVHKNYEWVSYPDGERVYLLTSKSPFIDDDGEVKGLVGNSIDMTYEHTLEQELQKSKNQFDAFMSHTPANVYIIKDYVAIYANKSANNFFKKKSIVGLKAEDIVPVDQAQHAYELFDRTLKEGVQEEFTTITNSDGKKTVLHRLMFPMESEGSKQVGLISFDVTKSYENEKKLHDQEEIMIAQSRHAAMGEMISMIAHQWRQPISVIAMDANNIQADIELDMLDKEELLETSKDIIAQTQELSKTIDDFRDFFKPNREAEKILLKSILDDALGIVGKSLENNNIALELEIDESIELVTYSRELMQVFINIIKNAKDVLTEQDIQDKRISITFLKADFSAKILLCDNGGGINSDIIKKVFNPYFTTKEAKNGTGLGLYMSKTIIEKHLNGTIDVANRDGGACFEIELPYKIQIDSKMEGTHG